MPVYYFENQHHPEFVRFRDLGRELSFGHPRGVAYERNGHFFATGLNRGGEAIAARSGGATIENWISRTFGDPSPAASLSNEPGVRFIRIARPTTLGFSNADPAMSAKANDSFIALKILLRKLEELFETIEPAASNLSTYGHRIGDVLLLACMEVESGWSAVLRENGYAGTRAAFTTNDYVKLLGPMMLDGYEMGLQSYSTYPPFSPFAGWNTAHPTQSLSWYDAYNRTKHDREANLHYATLENAVKAVGAVVVMFMHNLV
jgi:hypothetical protein